MLDMRRMRDVQTLRAACDCVTAIGPS
eukprot:COSAG02_NODE_17503_length_999_cov_1.065556_2_plen_26_part_01